jgi:hypothetical protein
VLLLNFFKTNEGTSRWFLKPGKKAQVTPLPKYVPSRSSSHATMKFEGGDVVAGKGA